MRGKGEKGSARDVRQFIRHFTREAPGMWKCVSDATLDTPSGRVQVLAGSIFMRGTRYMNVDVGEMLEAEYQRQQKGASPPA
jgi:hypothetical protein